MVQTLAVLCTLCIVSLALERPATSSWQSGNSTGLLCSSSWDAAGWVPRTVIKENDLSVVNMESDLFEVGYSLDLASGLTELSHKTEEWPVMSNFFEVGCSFDLASGLIESSHKTEEWPARSNFLEVGCSLDLASGLTELSYEIEEWPTMSSTALTMHVESRLPSNEELPEVQSDKPHRCVFIRPFFVDISELGPHPTFVQHCKTVKQLRQLRLQLRRPCAAWKCTLHWFISHKQWNAMMHSLHGNIPPDGDSTSDEQVSMVSQQPATTVRSQQARWPPERAPPIRALLRRMDLKNRILCVEEGVQLSKSGVMIVAHEGGLHPLTSSVCNV